MAKSHGAKQQKKLAKQKAKRAEKRSQLSQRTSLDPTIRLKNAHKWPVFQALVPKGLWEIGMGQLVIARTEGEGKLVYAVYLVDVFCLGIKDCFWQTGSTIQYKEMVESIEDTTNDPFRPATPEEFAKIVRGANDFAAALGFAAHSDYRHASKLLNGIDPNLCTLEFAFGKDGKPFYLPGPHDQPAFVAGVSSVMREVGGDFGLPGFDFMRSARTLETHPELWEEIEEIDDDEFDLYDNDGFYDNDLVEDNDADAHGRVIDVTESVVDHEEGQGNADDLPNA